VGSKGPTTIFLIKAETIFRFDSVKICNPNRHCLVWAYFTGEIMKPIEKKPITAKEIDARLRFWLQFFLAASKKK